MAEKFSHLIDLDSYPVSKWNEILERAQRIMQNPEKYADSCKGKIMATLFYEPSTRTQMSFQTAMLRLGGSLIGFDNPANSSVSKGENLKDTTKIVSSYADILVMRNPQEGSAKAAALSADCAVINAGDGGHLHPTQTLTDLLTLKQEKNRLDNLTVGLCGDLRYGRTVHSLLKALSCYEGNKFILISTEELQLPSYMKDILSARGCAFEEVYSLDDAMDKLDVLYMTRIQKERFPNVDEYNRQKAVFVLDANRMKKAKEDMIVMHPLPRVDEIDVEVDSDPRAMYFKQAKYGMYVRMSLILTILRSQLNEMKVPLLTGVVKNNVCCKNPKCITKTEGYLPHSFHKVGDIMECEYCDERILLL